jgi:hypothetical protein
MTRYEIYMSKGNCYAPGPVQLVGTAYAETFRDAVMSYGYANMQFGRDVDPDNLTWWYRCLWPTKEQAETNNYRDHQELCK